MNIIGKSVWDIKEYKGNKVFVAAYTTPQHCLLASASGGELIVKIKNDIIEYICDEGGFVEETA